MRPHALTRYRQNPIVLADHNTTSPIGNFAPKVSGSALVGVITFAPKNASAKADEYCALYKAGVLKSVSVGFRSIERKPISGGGILFTKWELLELSCVSVPCDPNALVVERAYFRRSGRVLNSANSTAIATVMRELDKCSGAHADALDLLDKADQHRERAARDAARIAASAQTGSDDGDADPDDDPDADVELGAAAARRKRAIEVYRLAEIRDPAAERRRRLVEVFQAAIV
jgi:HK97 family phage prohead protease